MPKIFCMHHHLWTYYLTHHDGTLYNIAPNWRSYFTSREVLMKFISPVLTPRISEVGGLLEWWITN